MILGLSCECIFFLLALRFPCVLVGIAAFLGSWFGLCITLVMVFELLIHLVSHMTVDVFGAGTLFGTCESQLSHRAVWKCCTLNKRCASSSFLHLCVVVCKVFPRRLTERPPCVVLREVFSCIGRFVTHPSKNDMSSKKTFNQNTYRLKFIFLVALDGFVWMRHALASDKDEAGQIMVEQLQHNLESPGHSGNAMGNTSSLSGRKTEKRSKIIKRFIKELHTQPTIHFYKLELLNLIKLRDFKEQLHNSRRKQRPPQKLYLLQEQQPFYHIFQFGSDTKKDPDRVFVLFFFFFSKKNIF